MKSTDMIPGAEFKTILHGSVVIIEYFNAYKVKVRFIDTGVTKSFSASNIRKGRVKDPSLPISSIRKGYKFKTKESGVAEVICIKDSRDITVMFCDTGNTVKTISGNVLSGNIKDRERPTVCGVGFIGIGKYKSNGEHIEAYNHWSSMIKRCYDTGNNSYMYYGGSGVVVCNEWHNFQNFADWYVSNRPDGNDIYHLDKDIMNPKRNIYSPEFCLIVTPQENIKEMNDRILGRR